MSAQGKELRLFCLPYAGGSARIFKGWEKSLPDWVEVCPLELPGRGTRFDEAPHTQLEPLVDDLLDTVTQRLDLPFAFFGYSYGSLLSYELARRLDAERGLSPVLLAVGACRSPDSPPREDAAAFLPEDEFRNRLVELGGTPRELLENDELMELMLPVVKADFWVADTYVYRPGRLLRCPVAAFGSEDDTEARPEAVAGWARQTSGDFTLHRMPGDHFFLHTHQELLLKELAGELAGRRPTHEGPAR